MILLAAAAALSACPPVAHAQQLWRSPSTNYVLVGETHGTAEAPELFADLACTAGKKRPVVVALEQAPDQQAAIDAFLASDGSPTARARFLKARMWNQAVKDGRSSEAMLGLFERLRELKQSGRIRGVTAFDDYDLTVPPSDADEAGNRGMAAALERIAAANPGALVLAYAGSVHMSLNPGLLPPGVRSAAARLPRAQTVTVLIDGNGGSAWNCMNSRCGPQPQWAFNSVCKSGVRQVVPFRKGGLLPGFDAIACVGKPFTASPPAVPLASN